MLTACLGLEPTLMAAELSGSTRCPNCLFSTVTQCSSRICANRPYCLPGSWLNKDLAPGYPFQKRQGLRFGLALLIPGKTLVAQCVGRMPSVFRLLILTGIVDANIEE